MRRNKSACSRGTLSDNAKHADGTSYPVVRLGDHFGVGAGDIGRLVVRNLRGALNAFFKISGWAGTGVAAPVVSGVIWVYRVVRFGGAVRVEGHGVSGHGAKTLSRLALVGFRGRGGGGGIAGRTELQSKSVSMIVLRGNSNLVQISMYMIPERQRALQENTTVGRTEGRV